MQITTKIWEKYIGTQNAIRKKAAEEMLGFINKYGLNDDKSLIAFAKVLTDKYGVLASSYACMMFDEIADAQDVITSATPADLMDYGEVAKAINGGLRQSPSGQLVPQIVERLVKQAGADTMLKNAKEYGAFFAWIPHGMTCPYCMMLGGIGWQRASSDTIEGDHAEHIHANCDCEFVIDFKGNMKVANYEPEEIRRKMLHDAGYDNYSQSEFDDFLRENGKKSISGGRNGLNAIRKKQYAENRTVILEQKKEAYEKRKEYDDKLASN